MLSLFLHNDCNEEGYHERRQSPRSFDNYLDCFMHIPTAGIRERWRRIRRKLERDVQYSRFSNSPTHSSILANATVFSGRCFTHLLCPLCWFLITGMHRSWKHHWDQQDELIRNLIAPQCSQFLIQFYIYLFFCESRTSWFSLTMASADLIRIRIAHAWIVEAQWAVETGGEY